MEQIESNYIDIQPIKKTKRILLFLADYFLTFIIAFILMNAAVFPLTNLIGKTNEKETATISAEKNRDDILYGNQLLFVDKAEDIYVYDKNLEYTFERYLSFYAFDTKEAVSIDKKLGNDISNEVILHYFKDIKNNVGPYQIYIKEHKDEYNFIEINETTFQFTEDMKREMKLHFLSSQDMSSDGEKYLTKFKSLFLNCYSLVMTDIKTNDLIFDGRSYNSYQSVLDDYDTHYDKMIVLSCFISFTLAWFIYFIVIPLINRESKTLAMIFMKRSRIGTNNLYLIGKREVVLHSILSYFLCISMIAFLPLFYVSFLYLFNMPFLFIMMILGFIVLLVSLIILLSNKMSRSLYDLTTKTVIITKEDMDKIYMARGYVV